MLEGLFDLSIQANTTQKQGPSVVLAAVQLSPGDAVALRSSGTLTNLLNLTVTCLFGVHCKDLPTGQSTTVILVGV